MLGRKDYTQKEIEHGKAVITEQLAAYKKLAKAMPSSDAKATSARRAFEPIFFNNLTMVLDRLYVHRIRAVTGKDGNPLNEVELLVDSLMNNDGIMRAGNVIKYVPEESVVNVQVGEPIRINEEQFERLAAAYFDELERRFL